jgi:hypothetical protein
LKEGSVLSPILFSIFIADIDEQVLRPTAQFNFLHGDCYFEGILVNGLMFADDLVIFARSERALRARLKLLESYAGVKKLTVNTGKCEIVVFGCTRDSTYRFRFRGQLIPVVQQCKYLGVFLDRNAYLKAHTEHLRTKFQNAVGTFFRLGRYLALSELKTWGTLQNSLLFSTLYGVELTKSEDFVAELAGMFRKGLRSFIGVPNRVSNDLLDLIFPDFSFDLFFLKRKHGYLRRMTQTCETLAAGFFLEDRVVSFPAGRGFSHDLQNALRRVNLEELTWSDDKALVNFAFKEWQKSSNAAKWVRLVGAKSTRFLGVVFGEWELWHEFISFAAQRSLPCLRVCLLSWSGSTAISSGSAGVKKCPFCTEHLDTRHYFTCGKPPASQLEVITTARHKDWDALLRTTTQVYFRFLFQFRPSVLSADEGLLLEWTETTT